MSRFSVSLAGTLCMSTFITAAHADADARAAPQRLLLDPTPRSRLRWWPVADAQPAP